MKRKLIFTFLIFALISAGCIGKTDEGTKDEISRIAEKLQASSKPIKADELVGVYSEYVVKDFLYGVQLLGNKSEVHYSVSFLYFNTSEGASKFLSGTLLMAKNEYGTTESVDDYAKFDSGGEEKLLLKSVQDGNKAVVIFVGPAEQGYVEAMKWVIENVKG